MAITLTPVAVASAPTAIEASFCENSSCTGILVKDTLGAYEASTNPDGYTAGQLGAASAATVTVSGDNLDTPVVINVGATLPSNDPTLAFTITPVMLDSSWTKILDGAYTLTYDVTFLTDAGNVIARYSKTILYLCTLRCKIKSLGHLVSKDECTPCESEYLQAYLEAHGLLDVIEDAADCADFIGIDKGITLLNKKLINTNCSDC